MCLCIAVGRGRGGRGFLSPGGPCAARRVRRFGIGAHHPQEQLLEGRCRVFGRQNRGPGAAGRRQDGFAGLRRHARGLKLENIPDQQERYELISQHLVSAKLPQAVEFAFIDQGIRVNGAWHPILKMDWVVGMTLAEYVGRHLDDRRALNRLAERFLELLDDLRTRQIAHGDLQHGNLLVVDGHTGPSLRLINYNGM